MTTRSKTRKTPAAKARTPKAGPKSAATETKQQVNGIRQLISRWKWLDADETYQADFSTTDEECDKAASLHGREKAEIIRKLVNNIPETFFECGIMLGYATQIIGHGDVDDDDIIALLKNVRDGLRIAQGDERKSARKEGMEEMRSHYVRTLDLANRLGTHALADKL